jgi:hypothetical protein
MPRTSTESPPRTRVAKLSRADRRVLRATSAAEAFTVVGPPDLAALPRRVDRRTAAAIVTAYFFPVSHRSIERWSLPVRCVGGYALYETADVLAAAERRLGESTPISAGRRARVAADAATAED